MFFFVEQFDSNPNSHADANSCPGAPAVSSHAGIGLDQ
jgi:hypothetical protein